MPFTPEQMQQLIEILTPKLVEPCASCGHNNFSIQGDIVMFPLQPRPGMVSLGGPSLPCLPVICTICGNTLFYNVFVLGVAQILGISSAAATEVPHNA
jgi:hypothetical protein